MKLTKKVALFVAGIYTLLATALALNVQAPTAFATEPRDCGDGNAIIDCGALTATELKTKYTANKPGDIDDVYNRFGITSTMISNASKAKIGSVTKDGKVIVDGKTVATGAITVGRKNMTGSTAITINGKTYYQRTPSVSFQRDSLAAFVFFDANGKFIGAVLQSCGNPVKATPVAPKPTPAAACTKVTPIKISRDRYDFKGTATASGGATIKSYHFLITHSSGTAKIIDVTTSATSASTGAVQLEDGTHTVKLTVRTSLGDRTSTACEATVTVPPVQVSKVEVCNPTTGEIIEVNEADASKYKPKGDVACSDVQVCNPTTGEIITVKKSEESKYKPVGDAACTDVLVCNPATGNTETVKKSEEANFKPVDDEACKHVEGTTTETPPAETPPAEIASTGPTDLLMGGAGVSSLTAAGYYWRASRRRFLSAMLNR